MSNLYYESSAVLRLDSITPVISALFEPLGLEAMPPEHGKCRASVAIEPESTDASWDRLRNGLQALSEARRIELSGEQLETLASTWGVTICTDPTPDGKTLLLALADDLDRVAWPGFLAFLDDMDEAADATISDRFLLAMALDDGHGLEGLTRSASWYSSKTSALSNGGAAEEIGPQFSYSWNSDQAIELSQEVSQLLSQDRGEEAAHHLCQHVKALLLGLHMPQHRAQMKRALLTLAETEAITYFAIWGRLPHDDHAEDSMDLIEAISQEEAERSFSDGLWAEKHADPLVRSQARGEVKQEFGVDVYVNRILCSSTPINFA